LHVSAVDIAPERRATYARETVRSLENGSPHMVVEYLQGWQPPLPIPQIPPLHAIESMHEL
jgi:hypothetical protein